MPPTTTAAAVGATTTASKLYMAGASASSSSSSAGGGSPSPAPPPKLPTSASSRRFPPPCWTHEETLALIDSYRDKWYSLRRGNLRASHWEDVADSLSRRCHHLPAATPKTSVQCRHKVEKLRKRYRAEKQRSLSNNPSAPFTSSWVYFPKMDAMENGNTPSLAPAPSDDEDDYAGVPAGGTTRSLQRLMGNGSPGGIGGLKFQIPKAARSKAMDTAPPRRHSLNTDPSGRSSWGLGGSKPGAEEMRRRLEKRGMKKREREGEAVGEMVTALRMLADGFMRTEQMKMEMAREIEKVRMEMEVKRTEMMIDCQRQIVDSLLNGFVGKKKKAKISPDP